MTNAVAATSTAASTAETRRTQAARSNGASYAEFQAAAAKDSDKTTSSNNCVDVSRRARFTARFCSSARRVSCSR